MLNFKLDNGNVMAGSVVEFQDQRQPSQSWEDCGSSASPGPVLNEVLSHFIPLAWPSLEEIPGDPSLVVSPSVPGLVISRRCGQANSTNTKRLPKLT
ncbi:hypothetical protein ElyMa_002010800 [Elysia marginata]|uniref:Uncharacterized protein n=1 Tax=Elysia marginata TaxID=1093978 RepID=A0AAV4F3F8_9GAST|nr:hypothetical protein ElyMa_002010800 [Elysia marginata]